jgi:hypothetical protein
MIIFDFLKRHIIDGTSGSGRISAPGIAHHKIGKRIELIDQYWFCYCLLDSRSHAAP